MNSARFVLCFGFALMAVAAWWLWPVTPVNTPHFQWQPTAFDRYELLVSRVRGSPEFRSGVLTTPVPHSGPLLIVGTAEPDARIEVSNPRTGRRYFATADAAGEFALEAEARRGDALNVVSRQTQPRRGEVAP